MEYSRLTYAYDATVGYRIYHELSLQMIDIERHEQSFGAAWIRVSIVFLVASCGFCCSEVVKLIIW